MFEPRESVGNKQKCAIWEAKEKRVLYRKQSTVSLATECSSQSVFKIRNLL